MDYEELNDSKRLSEMVHTIDRFEELGNTIKAKIQAARINLFAIPGVVCAIHQGVQKIVPNGYIVLLDLAVTLFLLYASLEKVSESKKISKDQILIRTKLVRLIETAKKRIDCAKHLYDRRPNFLPMLQTAPTYPLKTEIFSHEMANNLLARETASQMGIRYEDLI